MRTFYLDYAMSVIIGRAIPDVRDGLKPVHRRILYAMHREGLRHNGAYTQVRRRRRRRARKYHPHGDASVYDALVRLAQDWTALPAHRRAGQLRLGRRRSGGRLPLHRGAPREARRRAARRHRQGDRRLRRRTSTTPRVEPTVLPARFPNLLVNGSARHRGRHGDQHPAAQPRRDHRRDRPPDPQPRRPRSTS